MKNEITTLSIIIIVTFWFIYKLSKLSKWKAEERALIEKINQLKIDTRKWEMDCDNLGMKNPDVKIKSEEIMKRSDELMLLHKKVYHSHPFLGWFYSAHIQ
jgi:hypothetical protein